MRDAFKALDKDSNGKISETELRQILGNLGDALTTQEVTMTQFHSGFLINFEGQCIDERS